MRHGFGAVAGLALLVLASATAGVAVATENLSGLSDNQAAALEQRVRERWQTKSDREFGKTWEFSTPNFREVFPKSLYIARGEQVQER